MSALGEDERAAVVAVLDEMRTHGTGATLYYAEKLATALSEPPVLTPDVVSSGRLTPDVYLARIEAVLDDWLTHAGPGSEAHRVFGPQVVTVSFAVDTIRAALAAPTTENT